MLQSAFLACLTLNVSVLLLMVIFWLHYAIISDAAENMKELLSEITRKESMPTSKRMGYLNNFAQVGLKNSVVFILQISLQIEKCFSHAIMQLSLYLQVPDRF